MPAAHPYNPSENKQLMLLTSIIKLEMDPESYKKGVIAAIKDGGGIDKLPKNGITYLTHVLNHPKVTPEHVKALFEAVREANTTLYDQDHAPHNEPSYVMHRLLN